MRAAQQHERTAARRLASLPSRKVAVFHVRIPHADASGTDLRLRFFLEELARAGHRVTLVVPTPASDPAHAAALEQLGIQLAVVPLEGLAAIERGQTDDACIKALLREGMFDLALIFQWHWAGFSVAENYLPHVRWHSPLTRIALLIDELPYVREGQRAEFCEDRFAHERALGSKERETDVCRKADLALVLCDEDGARIKAVAPATPIGRLSYGFRPIPEETPDWDGRRDVVFVGSGENRVNRDTVTFLVDEVWPLVQAECPELELHVIGPPPAEGWFEGERTNVVVAGRVPDCQLVMSQARAMVSPIPYGSGLRSKHVSALAAGLPVVTTARGAEGMGTGRHRVCIEAETALEFAAAVTSVAVDRSVWQPMHDSTLAHARRHFGRAALCSDLHDILAILPDIAPKRLPSRASSPGLEVLGGVEAARRGDWRTVHYEARLDRARGLIAANRLPAALQEFRNILCDLQNVPDSVLAGVLGWLGRIHSIEGRAADALACLEASEAANADAPEVTALRRHLLASA